jgi:hypothetical protein
VGQLGKAGGQARHGADAGRDDLAAAVADPSPEHLAKRSGTINPW